MENILEINYDLSQDLLLNDVVKPLKTICLLRIIPRFFTHTSILRQTIPIYPQVTGPDYNYGKAVLKEGWDCIEILVVNEVQGVIPINMRNDIKEAVHFVWTQIFLFLSKNRYFVAIMNIILKHLEFTWQGTINTRATFRRVLESRYISFNKKFEILCQTFLSDDLTSQYILTLKTDTITRYITENPKKENIYVYFWICRFLGYVKKINFPEIEHVTGENGLIYFSDNQSLSTIEYLFYWSFYTFNDMAVQYLWERFISRTKERDRILTVVLTKFALDFRTANSVIYLLSNVSDGELKIFLDTGSAVTFEYILLELRWHSLFGKMFEVLHTRFGDINHIVLFKFMTCAICLEVKDKFNKHSLKNFLIKMPASAKNCLLNDHQPLLGDVIQKLFHQEDLEYCSLLFTIDSPLNLNSVFISSSKITFLDLFIISRKCFIIDIALEHSFNSSIPVKYYKIMLGSRAYLIFQYSILFRSLASWNRFMGWCYGHRIDTTLQKIHFLIMEDGKLLKKLIFQDRETNNPFKCVNKVLKWTWGPRNFTRIKKRIKMAKANDNTENSPDVFKINIYAEIRACVLKRQLVFLNRLFKWKPISRIEKRRLKHCLLNDNEIYQFILREKKNPDFFSLFIKSL